MGAHELTGPPGDVLRRHVPEIGVDWLLDMPERAWRVVDGSLCFADISGFTALSERLARRGRIGAEELVETLSRVFGGMLDIAAARGGQLLKFGGDALLFLFTGDDHAHQAVGAAVEMRRELRRAAEMPTSVGRLRLSMSVGVHSGDVHLFLVGAPNRELVVLGPTVAATVQAESTATAGQILVSAATAARLPASATAPHDDLHRRVRWRAAPDQATGAPVPRDATATVVRSLLPPRLVDALAERVEPGHRIATVAFLRFSGTDAAIAASVEDTARALDETVRTVQAALVDEHVTLLTIDVDSDGGKFFCSAGVPSNSEDDEGRMLRALRRIAATPVPFPIQAGVNRGHVFAAELGTARRAAYSAMGDTTNTAARIASRAPAGAVFAHPSVLDHARTLYEAHPVGPFTFKGKSEPMTLYEVGEELGARGKDEHDTLPMRGRSAELAVLDRAIDDVLAGRGGVITVAGPAGMGKSRIVAEALAARERMRVVPVRAEPYGAVTPYRPLRDPTRRLLGVERADSATMTAALLAAVERVSPALVPLAPLLGAVAHIDVPETPESAAVTDRHRPDRTADVVIELLSLAMPGPLVIVSEDAQWVDESTTHLLERVAAATSVHPWLLIVTRRDTDGGFVPTEGEHLAVGPLSDDVVRELTVVATEATPLRPHEIDEIVARAAGSPLFIEELARAVRTVGSLQTVPESMHAAIAAQVDALNPAARRVLAYAAVLGRSFRRQVLFELMQADGFELDEATRTELDRFFDRDGETRVRFRNGLIRDVTYEGMAFRTRARLHGAAASTLERISEDRDLEADMLAHHFWQAGDARRTWEYSLKAADRARHAYANAEAAARLEQALDAARRLDDVSDLDRLERWLQLGDTRDRAGLLDGALDAYARAARLLPDDPLHKAELLLRRARTYERAGAYSVGLRTVTRARAVLDDHPGPDAAALRADALALAALLRQRQEHADDARRLAEQAMVEGDRAAARSAQARASNVISWAETMLGGEEAVAWARRAMELYEAAGDLDGQADMANNLGVQAYFEGRWDETLEYYQQSRDTFARVGSVIDAAASDANIGEVLVNQRRFDEAEPLLRDARRVLRASGHRWGAAFVEMHIGRLLLGRDDLEAAEAMLRHTRDEFLALGRGASAYETALHLADCLTAAGRPDEALDVLTRAARDASDDVSIFGPARARFRACALLALDRPAEAVIELEQGIAVARRWGLDYELSLMLGVVAAAGLDADVGSDEAPGEESARLLARLGVQGVPSAVLADHFHIGSPAPS